VLLRPRQKEFVERCIAALDEHGNTAGVAPTGAGKTIMLSAASGRLLRRDVSKALILQHRDELLRQNASKFMKVNPEQRPSVYNAERKDWRGDVVFASEPTLRRWANLNDMPPFDLAVIDEAHHVAADGYQRIVGRLKEINPAVKILGVTATPNRGDKKALEPTFTNVGDQITIGELIASGHLVPPRTFVIDVGVKDELAKVKKTVDDFDMNAVAAIMDKPVVNEAVVEHWLEKAGNRRTVVFCSTIAHAEHVMAVFRSSGVSCNIITGELDSAERRRRLAAYAAGDIQVLVNIAVLTEGWDDPPTSCVVLLRPSSYKSTYLQMVGRGLRVINPEEHPNIIKTDCIILDFGRSTLVHGSLEQRPDLKQEMACEKCGFVHPKAVNPCPNCGYDRAPEIIEGEGDDEDDDEDDDPGLRHFVMTEIDLLKRSSFRWIDPFGDENCIVCTGFTAWAGAFWWNGNWHAIGGVNKRAHYLGVGNRVMAIAMGDDWMNEHETEDAARKTARWMKEPASDKQLQYLDPEHHGASRYHASCLLQIRFNKTHIKRLVMSRPVGMAA
jgi:DNA repair protein RadD